MAALPIFISLLDAATKLGIPDARLLNLLSSGRMKAAEINGEVVVSEESVLKVETRYSYLQISGLPSGPDIFECR